LSNPACFESIHPYYLDYDEYAGLQHYLMSDPEVEDLIPIPEGVQKFRWQRAGMGKVAVCALSIIAVMHLTNSGCFPYMPNPGKKNTPTHIARQLNDEF